MNANEQADFVRDGRSAERLREFLAGEAAATRWERAHPLGLADYLRFLDTLQAAFGPFPVDRTPWPGEDYRL